jgi:hypothetical protein
VTEKLVAVLICLISLIFLGLATQIQPSPLESSLGAGFWPKVVLISLLIASGIHLIKLLLRKKEIEERLAKEREDARKKEEEETGERQAFSLFLFGCAISFIYIFIIRWIGFVIATPISMAIFMYVTGYRKKAMLVVIPLVTLVIYLLLFVKATYIPLPRGFSIFKDISVLFY